MSRSTRRSPVMGIGCAESEKAWKQQENQRLRARRRSRALDEIEEARDWREGRASWGPKDGKHRFDPDKSAQRLAASNKVSVQRAKHRLLAK